jgi:hypothetical protein
MIAPNNEVALAERHPPVISRCFDLASIML